MSIPTTSLNLSSPCFNVGSTLSPPIAYPGKGGTWKGGWNKEYGIHAWSLHLTTETPDSFLGKIQILCLRDGNVDFTLSVKDQELGGISHDQLKFEEYLKQNGLPGRNQINRWVNLYGISKPEERKKIYDILVANNKFPEDVLKNMKILADTSDWHKETWIPIESSKPQEKQASTQSSYTDCWGDDCWD